MLVEESNRAHHFVRRAFALDFRRKDQNIDPVVAAFHNISAELLKESSVDCDVIVCSDDKQAAQRIRQLARKISGVRALDGGKLENARIVEQITALLIGFNIRGKGHSGLRITGLPSEAYDV